MSSLWMFPALIAVILTGFPVALTMMALAVVFGLHSFGLDGLQYQFIQKIEEVATAQVLAAVPLFIFMGAMFEASGIASRLFDAIHMWTRRMPGGLAVGTVIMCVIFAATSGVVGATETVVGLLAIPAMLQVQLLQEPDLRHDLRRRLARHHHSAVGARRRHRPGGAMPRSAISCSACSSRASCWRSPTSSTSSSCCTHPPGRRAPHSARARRAPARRQADR